MSNLDRREFERFWRDRGPLLLGDAVTRSGLATLLPRFAAAHADEPAARNLETLLGDAAETLELVQREPLHDRRILEIGGGIGLFSAWLCARGFDVASIEPSLGSHDAYYELGKRIHELLGLGTDRWLPLRCEEIGRLEGRFDLILSNNVLEHVADLPAAFRAMASKLAVRGRMRHQCPNYAVPYEPHFGLPLIPGLPRATGVFVPRVRASELWQSLNFVTTHRVRRLARENGLRVRFDAGMLAEALRRLDADPQFASKHPGLRRLQRRLLTPTGLIRVLERLPAAATTPMRFTLERDEAAPSTARAGVGSG